MRDPKEILEDVKSLEAFFLAGLQRATGLRTELEAETSPAPRKGRLTEIQEAKLIQRRHRNIKHRKP